MLWRGKTKKEPFDYFREKDALAKQFDALVEKAGIEAAVERDVNAAAKMHRLAGARIHQRCWQEGPRTGGLRQTSDLGGIIRRCVRAGTA